MAPLIPSVVEDHESDDDDDDDDDDDYQHAGQYSRCALVCVQSQMLVCAGAIGSECIRLPIQSSQVQSLAIPLSSSNLRQVVHTHASI